MRDCRVYHLEEASDMERNEMIYYAKSANQAHEKITNREHLDNVRRLSAEFGRALGLEREAELAGLFHDFGKYSARFQNVLSGKEIHVDHAFAGAAFLYRMTYLDLGRQRERNTYKPIIEAIIGHHDGLVSLLDSNVSDDLTQSLLRNDADCCPSGKAPALRGSSEFQTAAQAFQKDFPEFRFPKLSPRTVNTAEYVRDMLDTRMLFSCLVDADYSVSTADDDPSYPEKAGGAALDVEAALQRLLKHQMQIRKTSTAAAEMNQIRNQVFDACGQAATDSVGLFTLTAPTGVGKTLAMMNFALRHCRANGLRRIIMVLPFLSLAEQTQSVYRNIFPEILVDHSQQELTEQTRDMAARWDAPVIITTSVRFFEGLFSNKPTDCRKLHHIANSVVLFDEAQSLPGELAKPTVEVVQALCEKYHCSIVFSTATQPDFSGLPKVQWKPREILPDHAELFSKTRRVAIEWRLAKNKERQNRQTLAQIAAQMAEIKNVCCIVNLRRHARALIQTLIQCKGSAESIFLISTDLCPAHRLDVIERIKQRQRNGEPCCVVATQCIEAGVDLDFDVMYRALAPLEAIVQAAGRCNRNGRCSGGGRMIVFEPNEKGELYPDESYGEGAGIVAEMWGDLPQLDIQNPELICRYYRKLFSNGRDKKRLQDALRRESYAEVAEEYKLISKRGMQLIVPWAGAPELFVEITEAAKNCAVDRKLLRKAAPITITCFDDAFVKRCASPLMYRRHGELEQTGHYIVNLGFEACYNRQWGLSPNSIVPENYFI